ncbi:hypothetical protein GBZ86_13960, partial [Clostridium tarantellae]|nr:hypothetical protein [Clostridium tarantellae]
MINIKERNLKESCYGIFSIAFIINFFIFLLFIGNFNTFIYTYIILFDIFTLINLIFIKKLYNDIELYSSISLSLFSLILFVSGLY